MKKKHIDTAGQKGALDPQNMRGGVTDYDALPLAVEDAASSLNTACHTEACY